MGLHKVGFGVWGKGEWGRESSCLSPLAFCELIGAYLPHPGTTTIVDSIWPFRLIKPGCLRDSAFRVSKTSRLDQKGRQLESVNVVLHG